MLIWYTFNIKEPDNFNSLKNIGENGDNATLAPSSYLYFRICNSHYFTARAFCFKDLKQKVKKMTILLFFFKETSISLVDLRKISFGTLPNIPHIKPINLFPQSGHIFLFDPNSNNT